MNFLGSSLKESTVENERAIEQWNAQWMIVAGRAVCTSCAASQALEDCEQPFSHADTCAINKEGNKHPWVALHDMLDRARG